VAAVVGREFTFPVLAEIHGHEEEATVHALDELWQRGILREQGADAYGFSHDKVREVAYEELSPVRRRYLHQRVAETLCTLYPANLDALSGQIAGHFDQAGLAEQAVVYYRRAAEAARHIYANEDAAASLQRACYLLDQMPTSEQLSAKGYRLGGQCCEDKGDALVELRDFDGARAAYNQALNRVPSDERLWHSRLHCKMGQVAQSQGDFPLAWQEYAFAEQALSEEIFEPISDWWQAWIECQLGRMWAHYSLAQADEIIAIAEQCQDSVMEFGTAEQRADFLACQLAAAFRRERYRVSEETLALAHIAYSTSMEAASDQREISLAWFRLGFVRLWGRDLDGALNALRTGLPLAEEIHDLELHTQFLVYLAIVHRLRGDTESGQALAEQTHDAAGQSSIAIYDAAAKANLGWLAWREGKKREMRALVHEAIRLWQATSYPFAWLARMPLLADALERNQIAESVEQAQALLDPVQMQFPNDLATVLEQAVTTWHTGDSGRTQEILASAVALAQVHGYV
jgi:tetratricopeptide (TPR) repeat protein